MLKIFLSLQLCYLRKFFKNAFVEDIFLIPEGDGCLSLAVKKLIKK